MRDFFRGMNCGFVHATCTGRGGASESRCLIAQRTHGVAIYEINGGLSNSSRYRRGLVNCKSCSRPGRTRREDPKPTREQYRVESIM